MGCLAIFRSIVAWRGFFLGGNLQVAPRKVVDLDWEMGDGIGNLSFTVGGPRV